MFNLKTINKKAFTLAEVLITLAVVGVVAAITIPVLINVANEQQYKTSYRKAYGDLSNAFNKARLNGEFESISNGATAVRTDFDAIKANFKVIKSCENSISEGCWIDSCDVNKDCSIAALSGERQGQSYGFIDASGRAWIHYKAGGTSSNYPYFVYDTNGAKGPNSFGRDRWSIIFEDSNGVFDSSAKTPFKLRIPSDIITSQENGCAKGNCYYKSWLIGE